MWHVDIIHYTGGHDRARVQCGMLILFITQVDTIEHEKHEHSIFITQVDTIEHVLSVAC